MADAVPRPACQICMSAPLLEADSLGFVYNLCGGDSGVICDRLEGRVEFTLCGWLQMAESLRRTRGQDPCTLLNLGIRERRSELLYHTRQNPRFAIAPVRASPLPAGCGDVGPPALPKRYTPEVIRKEG